MIGIVFKNKSEFVVKNFDAKSKPDDLAFIWDSIGQRKLYKLSNEVTLVSSYYWGKGNLSFLYKSCELQNIVAHSADEVAKFLNIYLKMSKTQLDQKLKEIQNNKPQIIEEANLTGDLKNRTKKIEGEKTINPELRRKKLNIWQRIQSFFRL